MPLRLSNRLFWSAFTVLGTTVLTSFLVNALPGDVARVIAGPKASADVIKAIHTKLHLDEPLWKRLGYHLNDLAHGDLGRSYGAEQPVAVAILTRLLATVALSALAIVLWMFLAVPLGVLTAKYSGSWFDRFVLMLAMLSLSLSAFWLARRFQYWLYYKLGWFPVAGLRGFTHLLLPAGTLALLKRWCSSATACAT